MRVTDTAALVTIHYQMINALEALGLVKFTEQRWAVVFCPSSVTPRPSPSICPGPDRGTAWISAPPPLALSGRLHFIGELDG